MPRLDGTGPAGQGPMTGRKMGRCPQSNDVSADQPLGFGRGKGLGRGLGCRCGRGFRNRFFQNRPQQTAQDSQTAQMQQQIEILQNEITQLRQGNENSDNQR